MKNEIFKMYNQIAIGKNDICLKCKINEDLTLPLSIYHASENFSNLSNTVMFVGKNAVGSPGKISEDSLFMDATDFGKESIDLLEEYATRRAFYSYSHEIIKRHFGSYDMGKDYVALSNIIKCNNKSTQDATSYNMKNNCINDLGVIWKEVEILNPKRIIFYTARHYDEFIKNYEPKGYTEIIDVVDVDAECWMHRKYLDNNGIVIREILRTYHPERKNKEIFVNKICKWLEETKTNN